ncbi:septation regulator SpoVG [bacterium]|nr:septation regulator SpoVG [bacterium]
MEITDVQVFVVNEEKLKAYVTVTLDDCFLIRDLKVINGHSGLFVAMPAKKRKDGVFRDIAHPLNQQMRERLEERILEAFKEAMDNHQAGVTELPTASGS